MSLLAREATRRIEVRHLGIEALSHDEFILLRLIALAGHGRRPRYAGHLARGLVPERASAQLRTYAQGYFTQLQASGLTLSGWLETELVTQVH
ncbi:MAG: hypothetical protein HRT77_14525 [Halioglobus sp.]|nr:hypothetical protein [Halioglobus sp.]